MTISIRSLSVIAALAIASTAHAAPAPTTAAVTAAEPELAPDGPPALTDHDRHMMGARWSNKRLIGEILAGAVVGSLAAYATYSATCGEDSDCFGESLLSAGVNFAITPLAVWGTGRWAGGAGTIGWTYLGGAVSLAAFSAPGPADESLADAQSRFQLELAISTILLPITSSIMFELSSHVRYKQWQAGHPTSFQANIVPTRDRGGVTGAVAQVGWTF
jgi:hypothetical protein